MSSLLRLCPCVELGLVHEWAFAHPWIVSRPKPDTRICDHDRHANIKPKPDINKNQLNF